MVLNDIEHSAINIPTKPLIVLFILATDDGDDDKKGKENRNKNRQKESDK